MAVRTHLRLLRPSDLLCLDFELVNLEVAPDGSRLVRADPTAGALIIVHFPPQSIAEPTFTGMPPAPPIATVMAGPSRLVFTVDDDSIPLTTTSLLDWARWTPVLAPTALPRGTPASPAGPAPTPPTGEQTAIEVPWRLIVSPDAGGRWHTDTAAASSPYTQLWSAVLHPAGSAGPGVAPADLRAVGSLDGPEPFATSLTARDRRELVQRTANFRRPGPADPHCPEPIVARRLELTALGAIIEFEGGWNSGGWAGVAGTECNSAQRAGAESASNGPWAAPDPPIGLRQYRHRGALGRDDLVQTVEVGWLCGTGHRAVCVTTMHRRPDRPQVVGHSPAGGALFTSTGYLTRTTEVVVQQPDMDYQPLARAFAHQGRELPLTSIRLTTTVARVAALPAGEPAWLCHPDGTPLVFQAIGTDVAGRTVHFALPLMFVPERCIADDQLIRARFANPPPHLADAHRIDLAGQPVTVAAPGPVADATVLTVSSLTYDIEQPVGPANPDPAHAMRPDAAPSSYVPRFLMRVASLRAASPAVVDLVGDPAPVDLTWDPTYLTAGFAQNPAQTFVRFARTVPLALAGQRGGAVASLDLSVAALSRTLGPVAAPEQLQQGIVDLSAFAATKLLGVIPLTEVLPLAAPAFDAVAASGPPTPAQLDDPGFTVHPPRLTTRRDPDGSAVPDTVETRFLWKPPLRPEAGFGPFTLNLAGADLVLDVTVRRTRTGSARTSAVGRLRHLTLTFADALAVRIAALTFRAESGRKVEFGASGVELGFEGPLAFVGTLRSVLPADGFDDPPFVTADAQGVVAGYTLGVPSLAVGVFSIQNIAVSAALSIPFTDRPAGARFGIAERHKPFLVTVSLFGGGGFFALGVSAAGLETVEASLEFGGAVSLNLGVASGGVELMAGIYFGLRGTSIELTGYLRCSGALTVLGLVSLSVQFHLGLTYRKKEPRGSEVWGQASLTVSVAVAFFSTSVTLAVERRFAGSGGDPSFADTVTPSQWARYLQAFA